jgi:hypothetical protein
MTPETQYRCLEYLSGMLSPSQGWSEAVASLYILAMEGWQDDVAERTVKHAALNEKWRPAPAELRQLAARLVLADMAPVPSPVATRDEIRTLIIRHGRQAIKAAHSHPLIAAVVDEMGDWASLCGRYTEDIDAAFPGAYQRAVAGLEASVAQTQLCLPEPERRLLLTACTQKEMSRDAIILDRGNEDFTPHPTVRRFIEQRQSEMRKAAA